VTLDGRLVAVDAVEIAPNTLSILLDGQSFEINVDAISGRQAEAAKPARKNSLLKSSILAPGGRRHSGVEAEGRQQSLRHARQSRASSR